MIFATSILERISKKHREELEQKARSIFSMEDLILENFLPKSTEKTEDVRFILNNLPLEPMVKDPLFWGQFVELLVNIFQYSREDLAGINKVQYWISSSTTPNPINIFLVISEEDELLDKVSTLKDTIEISNILKPSESVTGKIVILGYDAEGGAWRINYI